MKNPALPSGDARKRNAVGATWRAACLAAALTAAPFAHAALGSAEQTQGAARIAARWAAAPIRFEPNVGQAPEALRFVARGVGYGVGLGESGVMLELPAAGAGPSTPGRSGAEPSTPASIRLSLAGANPHPRLQAEGRQPSVSNYFIGNDASRWRAGVANYGAVRYVGVYEGVDWVVYGNPQQLEYDLVVAPHADPGRIRMKIDGAERVSLSDGGELLVQAQGRVLRQHKPVVYQLDAQGRRHEVAGRYRLRDGQVAFAVGAYDRSRALVIDPTLSYSSYLGGTSWDYVTALAVDAAGNLYAAGYTESVDFPAAGPLQAGNAGSGDAFVAKFSADGKSLLYATYLGGSGSDSAAGVAVDAAGNAYVTGSTASADFPLRNAIQGTLPGSASVFVAKLNAAGNALVYSTYLGGSTYELAGGIAVDGAGNAYVTGQAFSTDFPTVNAIQPAFAGGNGDAFIAKLNAAGSALVYSTYLGGTGQDLPFGITVDGSGQAYVVGRSYSTDLPVVHAVQSHLGGGYDGWVAKLTAAGNAFVYLTYLGGSANDFAYGVAADDAGNAYVVGDTASANFPLAGALQGTLKGSDDAFVAKIAPNGSSLVYSTFIGGALSDSALGVSVDATGAATVMGNTTSADFPAVGTLQPFKGSLSAFVTRINPAGSALVYSTFYGGSSGGDRAIAFTGDRAGNVYLAGQTYSTDLPTVNAYQPALAGMSDGFVAKISLGAAPPATVSLTAAPTTIHAGETSTLTWSSTAATACTASGAWSGSRAISGTATVTPAAAGTYTYTLTCSGAGGSASATATVTVNPAVPVTLKLTAEPSGLLLHAGKTLALSWTSTGATTCTATGSWSGSQPVSGSVALPEPSRGVKVYKLACSGPRRPSM